MARVESLTHLGMGRLDDGQTLLPRVLPGEVVSVAQDGTLRIVTPSPDRVSPPCRHFKMCGGCAMQQAADGFVASWKQEIVKKALIAQGLTPPFLPMHISPPGARRRAKLSGRRTKKGVLLGFHARASDTLVPVPDCRVLDEAIRARTPALEPLVTLAASRKAEVSLTVTTSDAGLDVWVETDRDLSPQLRIELAALAQGARLARLTWNDEIVVTLTPPAHPFGRARVVPPPGAFLQATPDGEAALLADVLRITARAGRVVDLFSGCGTFALPLAEGAEVHAVEGQAEMLAALDRGWRGASGLKRVTTEARDLFRRPLEPDELSQFDAAIIDPPRAGAEAQVATLARSDIPRIAMVSCNPVTFARDASTLVAGGYGLDAVRVVDQFRWSTHVEIVAGFTRA